MEFEIRPISTKDEQIRMSRLINLAFAGDVSSEDDERLERNLRILPYDRTLVAFDGDEIVGTFGSFAFNMSVPGGDVPVGGTTIVTVSPTHRRRGILTAMMKRHLDDTRAWGEPIAALWASESRIYPRFGYGQASDLLEIEIDVSHEPSIVGSGDHAVRFVSRDQFLKIAPAIYDHVRTRHPGMMSRSEVWWKDRVTHDSEHLREGMSSMRFCVAYDGTTPRGYVIYRQKDVWSTEGSALPQNQLKVVDLQGRDFGAEQTLWKFLSSIDLTTTVRASNRPIDDPLPHWLYNQRRSKRWITDSLWVRILDVPAALEARAYSADGQLTIRVVDEFGGWATGDFTLSVSGGVGSCSAGTSEPALTMDVSQLGAMYLGGKSALALLDAGLIGGSPDAAVTADAMFRSHYAPWCAEIF